VRHNPSRYTIDTIRRFGWKFLGSWDPVHFDYVHGDNTIIPESIKAFQQLWNINNPNARPLKVDGRYGWNTGRKLGSAPLAGFAIASTCEQEEEEIEVPEEEIPQEEEEFEPTVNSEMTVTERGLEMMKNFEGFIGNFKTYSNGITAVGYGHKCVRGSKATDYNDCDKIIALNPRGKPFIVIPFLSHFEGDAILRFDSSMTPEARAVRAIRLPLKQHQFDALVSVALSVGVKRFKSSDLYKRASEGARASSIKTAFLSLARTTRGTTPAGLVNRRTIEATYYNDSDYVRDLCVVRREIGLCLPSGSCNGKSAKGYCPGVSGECCLG